MGRRCRLGKGCSSRKIQAVENGKGRRKRLEKGVGWEYLWARSFVT